MIEIPKKISDKVLLWNACEDGNPLKAELEKHFRRFVEEENDLSIEELFMRSFIDNHRMNVSFLPKTASYEMYGSFATLVNVDIDDSEKERLYHSVANGCKTKGRLKFKGITMQNRNATIEVDTNDIYALEELVK